MYACIRSHIRVHAQNCAHMHTYAYRCAHTHMYCITHLCAYVLPCVHKFTQSHGHKYARTMLTHACANGCTYIDMRSSTPTHKQVNAFKHLRIYIHVRMQVFARVYKRMRTNTHTVAFARMHACAQIRAARTYKHMHIASKNISL